AELLFDRRGAHRRRLQAVTQRLVVQHDDGRDVHRRVAVPVVDQRLVHDEWRLATTPATLAPATRTAPPHMSPCSTERWMAGRMISSTVTACPRPASASRCSAT